MTFEEQLSQLALSAVDCKSEQEAVEIARQIRELLHARIEELRSNLMTIPTVGPIAIRKESA